MQKGFTLIEIVIVISIIGVLVTLGASSYINVQKNARDTKRISDFTDLIKAMQIYHIKNATYPGEADDSGARITTGCNSDLMDDLVNGGYLDRIPTDPLDKRNCTDFNDTSYFYSFDDAHCCEASTCISINRLETEQAFEKLDREYASRLTVTNGCNGNIGDACTTERQFHYCFQANP